jgi:uncharacterized protein with FMN-binding domain
VQRTETSHQISIIVEYGSGRAGHRSTIVEDVSIMPAPQNNQTPTKLVIAALISGAFVLYSFLQAKAGPAALIPGSSAGAQATSGASSGATASAGNAFKDGTYTGSVADAQWGYVQAQAVIQGGQITNVRFLQYPNDRGRSIEINQIADPELVQEAIQAQSAQVDLISGATDSSIAFIQSLSDALSQARGA